MSAVLPPAAARMIARRIIELEAADDAAVAKLEGVVDPGRTLPPAERRRRATQLHQRRGRP